MKTDGQEFRDSLCDFHGSSLLKNQTHVGRDGQGNRQMDRKIIAWTDTKTHRWKKPLLELLV